MKLFFEDGARQGGIEKSRFTYFLKIEPKGGE
jgi:hypothetical protein